MVWFFFTKYNYQKKFYGHIFLRAHFSRTPNILGKLISEINDLNYKYSLPNCIYFYHPICKINRVTDACYRFFISWPSYVMEVTMLVVMVGVWGLLKPPRSSAVNFVKSWRRWPECRILHDLPQNFWGPRVTHRPQPWRPPLWWMTGFASLLLLF